MILQIKMNQMQTRACKTLLQVASQEEIDFALIMIIIIVSITIVI